MRKLKPEICTSRSGCTPPNDYCRNCSHAIFTATLTARGKKYVLEFRPHRGPEFGKSGQATVNPGWCPNRKHPVWQAYVAWFAKKFSK